MPNIQVVQEVLIKLRSCAAAVVLVIGTIAAGIVATPSIASAETGGCQSVAHGVHTSGTSPYRGWACWVDNGDVIRVCDNAPNDGVHVHGDIWLDGGGFWLLIKGEDDNEDAGCDDQGIGNLQGTNHLRLRVCLQRADQTNFACNEINWIETE